MSSKFSSIIDSVFDEDNFIEFVKSQPISHEPFADAEYQKFREKLLEKCGTDALLCPFCGEMYQDTAEYVDVGVGGRGVQVTPNSCEVCGASQTGAYELPPEKYDFIGGWHRMKEGLKKTVADLYRETVDGSFTGKKTIKIKGGVLRRNK